MTESRRPLRVSPSQVKRWRQCPRLSAFQFWNTAKVVDPFPRANDLGSRCHEIAEAWLRDGKAPDATEEFVYFREAKDPEKARAQGATVVPGLDGRWEEMVRARPGAIVHAGLHHLPAPGTPDMVVEDEISFRGPSGVYAARSDFRTPGRVGDHKFVRSLSYALTDKPGSMNSYGERNYLGDDPQFAIQTLGLFLHDPEAKAVAGTWVYYETRPTGGTFRTKKVHLAVTKDQAVAAMRDVERDAAQIQAVFKLRINPLDLPPNPESCKAYGRACDFVSVCNLTEDEKFLAARNEDTMEQRVASIVDRMMSGALGPTVLSGDDAPPPPPMEDEPPPPPLEAYEEAPPPPPDEDDAPPPPPEEEPSPLVHGVPREVWAALDRSAQEALIEAARTNLAPGMPQGPDPVNPPEAPPEDGQKGPAAPAARVEQVIVPPGGYEAMDRNALKALAVQRGLLPSSSRLGGPAILAILQDADQVPPPSAASMEAAQSILRATEPAHGACGVENPCADATPIRRALDRINAARRELQAAEEELHKALGI